MNRTGMALVVAIALAATACASADGEPSETEPLSLGTTAASTAGPATGNTSTTVTASTGNPSPTTDQVTPALGISTSSSDTYDSAYLVPGAGSNFVPLDDPTMVAAADVTWLENDAVVMGVTHPSGESHAYPVGQMAYHHIANTTLAGEPYLVTY